VHPEVQFTMVEGDVGVALSVTVVPVGKIAAQVDAQPIPPGVLMTNPLPPPKFTMSVGPVGPVPVKQTTVAVM
jgi:hypothetical protein